VATAIAPGARSAVALSIKTIPLLAIVLRTTAACAKPKQVELGRVSCPPHPAPVDAMSDENGSHARGPAVSTARTIAHRLWPLNEIDSIS
jgi:hypothetical protein